MSKLTKTLERILRGSSDANIRFVDLLALLAHLGFKERVRGDHHILTREGVAEILNLQPRDGQAKAYQVKQVRGIIVTYGLAGNSGQLADDAADSPGPERSESEGAQLLNNIRYEIILYWSQEDEAFIAEVPELPGCAADGATYQEALANAEVIIGEWIETARELGRSIPTPRGRLLYA